MKFDKKVNYFEMETKNNIAEIEKVFLDSNIGIELKWVCDSILFILEEINIVASIYMKWSMTINGLEVASNMYKTKEWKDKYPGMTNHFYIKGFRKTTDLKNIESREIILWDGDKASKAHIDAIPMIASSAIVDIYRHIENFIFELYRIYLMANPLKLINDNKDLKRLYENRINSTQQNELWLENMNKRIIRWWEKKSYSNLGDIISDYFNDIKIEQKMGSVPNGLEEVINTLKFIIEIRNSLVHNEKYISENLVELSKSTIFESFIEEELIAGEELNIVLIHLQYIDYSVNSILNIIYMMLMALLAD